MNLDLAELKRRLAALGTIEQGDVDISGAQPMEGLPANPIRPAMGGDVPDQPPREKVIQIPGTAGDDELDAAKELDAESMRSRLFETATRQLIGGLTRTPTVATIGQDTTQTKDLLAQRAARRAESLRVMEADSQGKRWEYDKEQGAKKWERDEERRKQDLDERGMDNARAERGIVSRDENTDAMRGIAFGRYGLDKAEKEAKAVDRDEKIQAGTIPFAGGTLTTARGLSDTERNAARTKASSWNAALGGMDDLEASLASYVSAPSREAKAVVDAKMSTVAAALNSALGQGAMANDEYRRISSTLGADLSSATGIEAALRSLAGEDPAAAGKLLLTKVRSAKQASRNSAINALKTYGDFADGDSSGASVGQDEVSKALEWARANPKDPRAAEIQRRHGGK